MEKSRNEGKNPSQENLNQKSNLDSNLQKDPRDTSTKGREEQVISQKNQTKPQSVVIALSQLQRIFLCGNGSF